MIISLERYEGGHWIGHGTIMVDQEIDQAFLRSMTRIGIRNLSAPLMSWARARGSLQAFVTDLRWGDMPAVIAKEVLRVYGEFIYDIGPVRLITFRKVYHDADA